MITIEYNQKTIEFVDLQTLWECFLINFKEGDGIWIFVSVDDLAKIKTSDSPFEVHEVDIVGKDLVAELRRVLSLPYVYVTYLENAERFALDSLQKARGESFGMKNWCDLRIEG